MLRSFEFEEGKGHERTGGEAEKLIKNDFDLKMIFGKIECVEVILYILYFHEVRTCLIIRKKKL